MSADRSASTRWHTLQAEAQRKRAEELARVVKPAIDAYATSNTRDVLHP